MKTRSSVTLACFMAVLVSTGAGAGKLPTIEPADAVARPGPIGRGDDADAARLIDSKAPALPELRWLDGQARTLESLRGRVVVIRSFTNECPFCAATMPTLQRLHERFSDRGVVVLGVYHPKPPTPTKSKDVARFANSLGLTFPVAVDEDWSLVQRWWKDSSSGPWTSITWVLDSDGTIRSVHPGGEYHDDDTGGPAHAQCRSDYAQLERTIERLMEKGTLPF